MRIMLNVSDFPINIVELITFAVRILSIYMYNHIESDLLSFKVKKKKKKVAITCVSNMPLNFATRHCTSPQYFFFDLKVTKS